MTTEQFDREKNYGAAISIAKAMRSKGLINEKEFHKIDAVFIKKYKPVIGSLRTRTPCN